VSGSTFQAGENLNMDINLSGDLSSVDELQFLIKKGEGEFIEQTTMSVTEATTYTYNWAPSEPGNYALRVTAKNNASYVTHVVVNNVTIEESQEPFTMSYASLVSGSTFQAGENLNMDINLSGDLSSVDELQFLIKKGEGEFIEQTTMSVTEATTYRYNWVPSEPGNYVLRVTAKNNGNDVTEVIVNNITVLETPILKLFNTNNINSQKRVLLVYPNPTNDFLTIENSSNETNYSILSLSGKVILEGKGKHINVINLPTGTYLLKMNNLIITKFIKN
jgi:hypothetical protein